jgi:predicted  nucleic acid-binding Zn-ribbon protein
VTSYNAKRRYTPNVDKAERTADLYREIFELRETVKKLEAERDRLRGSMALFEAELARVQKWYDGACLEIQRITGGI